MKRGYFPGAPSPPTPEECEEEPQGDDPEDGEPTAEEEPQPEPEPEEQIEYGNEMSAAMVGLASAENAKKSRQQQAGKKKDSVLANLVARAMDIRKSHEDNLCAKYIIKLHRVSLAMDKYFKNKSDLTCR